MFFEESAIIKLKATYTLLDQALTNILIENQSYGETEGRHSIRVVNGVLQAGSVRQSLFSNQTLRDIIKKLIGYIDDINSYKIGSLAFVSTKIANQCKQFEDFFYNYSFNGSMTFSIKTEKAVFVYERK